MTVSVCIYCNMHSGHAHTDIGHFFGGNSALTSNERAKKKSTETETFVSIHIKLSLCIAPKPCLL